MLSPFTPHMAEELWEQLGRDGGIVFAPWPAFDPDVAKADEVVVPVQVNGKVRGRVTVAADCVEDDIREAALADPAVAAHVAGQDRREGDRGEGQTRQHRGQVAEHRANHPEPAVVAALALPAAGCGYSLAGRGSFLPAYHQGDRRAGVRQPDAVLRGRAAVHRAGPLRVHRPRAVPGAAAGDGRRRGPAGRHHRPVDRAGELQRVKQQATRYVIVIRTKIEFIDVKTDKVLWENPPMLFREEYDLPARHPGRGPLGVLRPGIERARARGARLRPLRRQRDPRGLLGTERPPWRAKSLRRRSRQQIAGGRPDPRLPARRSRRRAEGEARHAARRDRRGGSSGRSTSTSCFRADLREEARKQFWTCSSWRGRCR